MNLENKQNFANSIPAYFLLAVKAMPSRHGHKAEQHFSQKDHLVTRVPFIRFLAFGYNS